MFDYKLLQALAVVLQEGGFDKAARTLHLTQSAVSQRLKQLEDQCGQILLARTTPPQPTPAGRILLKHYLQVCRLENEVQGRIGGKGQEVVTLAIGINADSLATWFGECIPAFVCKKGILIDLRVDDQDETHQLLKNGEVMGCISTQVTAMQGCTVTKLGCMPYRVFASADFAHQWFGGLSLTLEACRRAPFILFNRKDKVHHQLFAQVLGDLPNPIPTHYLPSSEKFVDFIASGMGYGMLPDPQSRSMVEQGKIIDLAPGHCVPVWLYWHCWNIGSTALKKLTQYLIRETSTRLDVAP
ncbi:MAG: LysR family transcriptional regulator ArgP [Desulfobulbus sp.]|nr:LysR family transcriptional regulator ArgP [Desulfobulbus sp.]